MEKPKVGQTLYSLNVGNSVSKYRPQELTEVVVKKVGRKYFYCGKADNPGRMDRRYFLDGWKQEAGGYSPTSALYKTKKEWEDEKERSCILKELNDIFGGYSPGRADISLSTLREIQRLVQK